MSDLFLTVSPNLATSSAMTEVLPLCERFELSILLSILSGKRYGQCTTAQNCKTALSQRG